eukprot:CAMPEP_0198145888 /NCGR_PEP_ID=MMETSP1443-20131203/25982_1 /TAXON_ID=186043 /ORGANISM="Entomoneis sp., Strain CCMP2396" /LENGTH=376 /DNA_ID=CAMNT_0043809649 /DNA_START=162 /DNA_END=1292 /DNA_ORIENTATION=-
MDNREEKNDSKSKLERTFLLIQEGGAKKKQDEFWEATQLFFQAHELLRELSLASGPDSDDDDGEQAKAAAAADQERIRALYKQQANEYFDQARQNLIKAMQLECDKDRENGGPSDIKDATPYKSKSLTDEEAQQRLVLFTLLFAREQDVKKLHQEEENGDAAPPPLPTESSLEERLRALNKSLPSKLKTDDERMREINQGLSRLGMSLYSHSDAKPSSVHAQVDSNKSEMEQVDDIIAHAKDEVLMSQQYPTQQEGDTFVPSTVTNGVAVSKKEDVGVNHVFLDDNGDSDLGDSDNDDDDSQVEIPKEELQKIQEKINEAQSSLAQLNALLAAAQEDADAEDADAGVKFDQNIGKKALKDARVLLQQATDRWRANL